DRHVRLAANRSAELEAAHRRHAEIRGDQPWAPLAHVGESGSPVECGPYLIAVGREDVAQRVHDGRLVVDDQDPRIAAFIRRHTPSRDRSGKGRARHMVRNGRPHADQLSGNTYTAAHWSRTVVRGVSLMTIAAANGPLALTKAGIAIAPARRDEE